MRKLVHIIKRAVKDKIDDIAARSYLPIPPNDNDLFIVEFPKSGVTWLSFLLANTALLSSGDKRIVTFFNVHDFVPDISVHRKIPNRAFPEIHYRLIKSHAAFTSSYKKVFYLVRDPRQVMPSYYRFLRDLGWYSGSLEKMLDHPEYGIDAWCDHVEGWTTNTSPSTSFVLIRYEDLLSHTAGELRTLCQFLGWQTDDGIIAEAVARSSLERMRSDEESLSARSPALRDFSFVRKEAVGGPRVELTQVANERIIERAKPLMEQVGYSF